MLQADCRRGTHANQLEARPPGSGYKLKPLSYPKDNIDLEHFFSCSRTQFLYLKKALD